MGKYDPERTFEFQSGPDSMVAELRRYTTDGEPYISFHGTGPRGGWVGGPTIPQSAFPDLQVMLDAAKVIEP